VEATIIPLAKANARNVAQTVQGLYRSSAPGGAQMQVGINFDERLNAIVVSAGEADSKRIAELVKKLDTDQVARVAEIRVIQLKFARAEVLSTILNTALNTRPPELTETSPNTQSLLQFVTKSDEGKQLITSALKEAVLITPDTRMNSLIVSAPVDYMGLLEQIVTRLDTTSPQQAKIKVFTMKNAVASQMATIIMEVFRLRAVPGATAASQQRSIQYTLVKPPMDDADYEGEDDNLASATLGSADQTSLTVTVDRRTNSLLVGGTDEYVDLVSQIVVTLDSCPAQERRSQVVRMKNAQALQVSTAVRSFLDQEKQRITQVLGADAVGAAQSMLDREVAIVAETNSNALLLSASPQYFDEIKQLIDQLDQPQPQVLIQVLLAEVSLDRANDLGLDWSYNFTEGAAKVAMSSGLGVASDLKNYGGFSSSVTGSDYNFLLRALENDGKLEVLSRPQILTGDNQPASINIGQRIPLITDSRVTERGDSVNSYRYEPVGVNMSVTPRIGSDGTVKMEISTTNSALSSSSVSVSSGLTMPVINERRAQTTVSVQSGQTIIIGGLISTSDDNRSKRLPWLDRIPGLGALFSNTRKAVERKELLILLTPQVLIDTEKLAKVSNVHTMTRDQLDKSGIRSSIKRDPFRKQLLDPLYPDNGTNGTNQPVIIERQNSKSKAGKS
jgi:type II secretion system protein D